MSPRTEREARNRARVVDMYRNGTPVREIAETIGYQATSVARIVTRAIPGDERRRLLDQRRRASRKYSLRSDLFQHPLDNDELWLLGLLMADGNVYQQKGRLSIGLAITDSDAVTLAARVAGSNAPLTVRKPKQGQGYGAHRQPQVCWSLHSQDVVSRAMGLGLVPRKSWREDVQVPETIAASPAFWRGIRWRRECLLGATAKRIPDTAPHPAGPPRPPRTVGVVRCHATRRTCTDGDARTANESDALLRP
jgi:hypothetical protein